MNSSSSSLDSKDFAPEDAVRRGHVVHRDDGESDGAAGVYGVVFVGATLGVASVLAALLVGVVVCFVAAARRRRRRKNHHHRAGKQQAGGGGGGRRDDRGDLELELSRAAAGVPGLRAANNHYVSTTSLQQQHARPPAAAGTPPPRGPPGTMHGPPSAPHGQPTTVDGPPSVAHGPPNAAHRPPITAHGPPTTVHGPPSAPRKDSRASAQLSAGAAGSPRPSYRGTPASDCPPPLPACAATLPVVRTCSHGAAATAGAFGAHTLMTAAPLMSPTAAAAAAADMDLLALQRRAAAWDALLDHHQHQQNHQQQQCRHHDQPGAQPLLPAADPQCAAAEPRPLSMSELPPPPDFLLDNPLDVLPLAAGAGFAAVTRPPTCQTGMAPLMSSPLMLDVVGSGVGSGAGRPPTCMSTPLMLDVVGDAGGYHSADSVDDVIDDVDFDIRQPPPSHLLRYA